MSGGRSTGRGAEEETVVERPSSSAVDALDVKPGTFVGRYVVVEHVGAGAMGQVLRAYDPTLGREVAIKRLRAGTRDPGGQARLLREARAMAQLSHPNVVQVYDVEAYDDGVAVAMEYVSGGTLSDWLNAKPRNHLEILQVLRRAGEGLAAAHRVELVHRDFKPANVLVADDGRVKVTDFGLAKPFGSRSDAGRSGNPERFDDEALTQAGTVMGTPRYMAPEQHAGDEADARADQYAYCVTLWEALSGSPPFSGTSFEELVRAKREGPPAWTKGRTVPADVVAAIRRGLQRDPSARWADMQALSSELDRWRARARIRRVAVVLGSLVALASIAVASHLIDRRRSTEACAARGHEIASSWPGKADTIHAGIRGSDLPYAQTTLERLVPRLDAWATEWAEARRSACIAHVVEHTMSPEVHDAIEGCLDESRERVETVLELWGSSDGPAIRNAIAIMAAQRLDVCVDEKRSRGRVPGPISQAGDVKLLRRRLARAEALQASGRYDEGEAIAKEVVEAAESLAFAPLVAEARLRLGTLLELRGEYASSVQELSRAYFTAASSGADQVAFEAAASLAFTLGNDLADVQAGLQWGEHARVAAVRGGDADPVLMARLLGNLAAVQRAGGNVEEARVLNEEALALRERSLGAEHPDVATSLNNLGLVLSMLGSFAEAEALHERALEIRERALGPDHPNVASSLDNLAVVYRSTSQYEEARVLNERARVIWEAALGPDHPSLAINLNALAELHVVMKNYGEAKVVSERALQIRERAFGPEHPSVAFSLDSLSAALWGLGEVESALEHRERALAIRETMFGPEHAQVGHTLAALADYRAELGSLEDARELYARALAIWEVQGETAMIARLLIGSSEVALRRRAWGDAVTFAARAVELLESSGSARERLTAAHFVLARALFEQGDRARARLLARRARDEAGEGEPSKAIDAWLAEHEGTSP